MESTLEGVLQKVEQCWQQNARLRIATVNPEYLVASEKNTVLKENLLQADVRVVDGFGLWLVLWLKGFKGNRVTGAQLTEKLLRLAEAKKHSVLVIVKKEGLSSADKTKSALLKKYPDLSLFVINDAKPNNATAEVTLIATGVPHQEYGAEQIKHGVVIGVGGSIDFLTGAQIRAPKIFQAMGLEWLWRLILQPKRFKRIWNAVVVFPFLVIFHKKRAGIA